MTLFVGSFDP